MLTPFRHTHLNKENIESNLSLSGIQGHQENALIKSILMSPHLICLQVSPQIPQGQSLDQVWIQAGPKGMLDCWCQRKWGLFLSSYSGRSHGTLGFQVLSSWIQFYLCSRVVSIHCKKDSQSILCLTNATVKISTQSTMFSSKRVFLQPDRQSIGLDL